MHYLRLALIAVLLFTACSKSEPNSGTSPVEVKDTSCVILSQSGSSIHDGISGNGYTKVLDANGEVKSFFTEVGENDTVMVEFLGKTANYINKDGTKSLSIEFLNGKIGIIGNGAFIYDNSGRLTSIEGDNDLPLKFTYDNGNLISAMCGNRSINYEYDNSKTAETQVYITTGNFFKGKAYAIAEIMDWLPRSKNLRTKQVFTANDSVLSTYEYSDHVVDEYNVLVSFKAKNINSTGTVEATIINEPSCTIR